MKPKKKAGYNVSAPCPDCDGTITSFEAKGSALVNIPHEYNGKRFTRAVWSFNQCAACGRGALAKFHDNGQAEAAVLETFFPFAVDTAHLPSGVPADIRSEF